MGREVFITGGTMGVRVIGVPGIRAGELTAG